MEEKPAPESRPRILIVDDSKLIRLAARKILRDHFETIEATNGEDAWNILNREEPFQIVISDLNMPKMDGFGLLERIRKSALPHIQDIPVIVVTGADESDEIKARANAAGATDFIVKPFDSVLLLARTQSYSNAQEKKQQLQHDNLVLEEQSSLDPLTGLDNETSFMEHGYQQLSYAVRHRSDLGVMRIEVDDFDILSKQYGRTLTDSVLKSITDILKANLRQEDHAARVGTARFALLLPSTNRIGIRRLADRICSGINNRSYSSNGAMLKVTVSIGLASPEIRRNTRFEELLGTADRRLVTALRSGGNMVVYKDGQQPTRRAAKPSAHRFGMTGLEERSITDNQTTPGHHSETGTTAKHSQPDHRPGLGIEVTETALDTSSARSATSEDAPQYNATMVDPAPVLSETLSATSTQCLSTGASEVTAETVADPGSETIPASETEIVLETSHQGFHLSTERNLNSRQTADEIETSRVMDVEITESDAIKPPSLWQRFKAWLCS